jgi:hypothetical protein
MSNAKNQNVKNPKTSDCCGTCECGTCSCNCEKNACNCKQRNCACGCSKPVARR